MFDHLKKIAKLEGCGRIEFTVLKWNKSAQEFYEKNKAKRLEWFLYRVVRENFSWPRTKKYHNTFYGYCACVWTSRENLRFKREKALNVSIVCWFKSKPGYFWICQRYFPRLELLKIFSVGFNLNCNVWSFYSSHRRKDMGYKLFCSTWPNCSVSAIFFPTILFLSELL